MSWNVGMKIRDAPFHQNPNAMNTSQQNSLHKHSCSDQNGDSLHKHRTWWTQNMIKPRTWFIAQAQQTHSSRSSLIKPRTRWRTANPSKQKIKTVKPKPYESNPCEKKSNPYEKKSIVIKWIKPSTGATDEMDLPTADQPMIHLLETQQTHQWEDQNSETKTVNPCEKKKIKPIKRSNPANGTDQPIHQANANQTH